MSAIAIKVLATAFHRHATRKGDYVAYIVYSIFEGTALIIDASSLGINQDIPKE